MVLSRKKNNGRSTASSIIFVGHTTNLGWMITPSTQLQAQELRRTLGAQRRSWCWFVHRDQQRYQRYRSHKHQATHCARFRNGWLKDKYILQTRGLQIVIESQLPLHCISCHRGGGRVGRHG